ncbi:hypothetical protein BO221_45415 [Archangium sp. Cb G35]|uniref:metallophosphoesterase n=1 Tax=Archangium sp. Cb G35 TaxID=1920190 RepID=UPI000937E7A6|nr:metallophosphoesterase [Archangium sp. Cb G35]OJT17361.1 hypothetical protein BO221_45415 [Archangium sp. Cb G35]
MAAEASRNLELEFVIAYPREAEVGKRYLMTVDVRARGPVTEWPYAQEEYELYCMVDSEPAFTNEPVGQAAVVLHRFGGTYGPARFVLTAREPMDEASIRLTLVNAAGLPLRKLELTDIRVTPPAPRQHLPPIEVWVELWKQGIDQYRVRLTSDVFGELEHGTSASFSQPAIFDEQHEGYSEARAHLGTELFRKIFATTEALRGWRAVRERARQERRSIRLLAPLDEALDIEQLFDPEAGFLLMSREPRIRIVRINSNVSSRQLELPSRPRMLLVALALQDPREAASILMKLALETADAYDISLFGPNGPTALREVVSTVSPKAWTLEDFLPFCDTKPTDLHSLSRLKGWELLHLLVSGLENVHAEEPRHPVHSAVYGLLSRELQLSGHFQLVFVQACRPYERHPRGVIYGHQNFFSGEFHPEPEPSTLAAVIEPLVPLDAEGSTSLAASFYRRLAESQPLDDALQAPRTEDIIPVFMHLWARPGALDPVRLAEATPPPKPQHTSRQAPANSIGWLFLSNVLAGSRPDTWEHDIRALLEDMERLHEKSGPWDLVLCAGDITLTGDPREFELASMLFTALRRRLVEIGMEPLILTVPGNHDGRLDLLRQAEQTLPVDLSITSWQPLLADAFQNYSRAWQNHWPPGQEEAFRRGLVPGDFSMTLRRNGMRWGIIGLNDILTPRGDPKNLSRQLDAVCDGGFAAWSRQHDACLLLAHDELRGFEDEWLSDAPETPFILHLTGRSPGPFAMVSSKSFVIWQGRTLFPQRSPRGITSGYFAGRLTLEGEESRVRAWPRRTEGSGEGPVSVGADREQFKLAEDEGFELAHTVRRAPASRNSEDWAIVVGISHYPELGNLEGPENDARAFRDWLLEKAGVPSEQLQLLLSSDFKSTNMARDAIPTVENVESLFDQFILMGEENEKLGSHPRVGRRLYIYLAGRGFMSADGYPALLTANARRRVPHHIPGWTYATYLTRARCFDEILLFMDCASQGPIQTALRFPPYNMPLTESGTPAKVFCAFSTLPLPSREHLTANGQVQGVFTQALLSALNGRASNEHGRITGTSLANYLNDSMREFLAPEEMENPDIFKHPQIIYDPSPDAELVIVTEFEASYWLAFRFAPSLRGQRVRLMHPQLDVVGEFQLLDPTMQFKYRGGPYLIDVSGELRMFTLREDSVIRLSQDGERIRIQLEPFGGNA